MSIHYLWLAHLNRNAADAGSDSPINLTINIDGEDVHDVDYSNVGDGEARLNYHDQSEMPFDSAALTNSSVRVGARDEDAWSPGDVLLFGHSRGESGSPYGAAVPLAMETGMTSWLSTDPSEGALTVPLRRIESGTSNTVIHRVLLVVHTQWATSDTGTDSPIQLEVFLGNSLLLRHEIADTSQSDLEKATSNWYAMDALVPFSRAEVQARGRIVLSILGEDAWKPMSLFVFGLDTARGRPNKVVSLVSLPIWGPRWMSTDTSEGDPSVELPVVQE